MRTSITQVISQKTTSTPIVMVTAYDATMAKLVDGIADAILVGDSLGMVVQGRNSTLAVTLEEIIYHTSMVARGCQKSLLIADLPFLTYQTSSEDALRSAGRCLKETDAQAVKLEGGGRMAETVHFLVDSGIPVVGHLGLTPQSINVFGGFGKRGKEEGEARKLLDDAKALEQAGASMIVLENIPHALAAETTRSLAIPTIGIGAGPNCDGQVQVFHDLFGLNPDFLPRHAKRYIECGKQIQDAMNQYASDVREGHFTSK